MKSFFTIATILLLTPMLWGCDEKPAEVGGTCDSMGGISCDCPDGKRACTNLNHTQCLCPGGAVAFPLEPVEPTAPVVREPVGGDCSSLGGVPCECPDGKASCTNHKDMCLCDGGQIPNPDGPHPEPPPPTPPG